MINSRDSKLRILFLGNSGYGGAILEELIKQNVEIVAVCHKPKVNLF